MRRGGWLLLCIALGTTGCLEMPFLEGKKDEQVVAPRKPAPAPPLVTPEQITAANAREMAEALRRELEWDENQTTPQGPPDKKIEP
jgi:hypothetical protein